MKHGVLSLGLLVGACAPQPSASSERKQPEAAAPAVQAEAKSAQPAAAAQPKAAWTRVEASEVCMVNNHYMGSAQIPVPVDGKTYYGCCKMCESRLQDDASSRMSVDPVSQQPVDKALAIIARNEGNKVLYFESEETFQRYLASL